MFQLASGVAQNHLGLAVLVLDLRDCKTMTKARTRQTDQEVLWQDQDSSMRDHELDQDWTNKIARPRSRYCSVLGLNPKVEMFD